MADNNTETTNPNPPAAEAVLGPIKKPFKGETRKLGEVKWTKAIPAERIGERVVDTKGYYGKVKVPRLFAVTGIQNSGNGLKLFNYFDYKTQKTGSFQLPNNYEFKELTGRQGKTVIESYDSHVFKSLHSQMTKFTGMVGSDPEIFVEDKKGRIIPAFKFLPDNKTAHKEVKNGYKQNAVYWDGYQAEFTLDPDYCLAWVSDNMRTGLEKLYQLCIKHNKGAKLSAKTLIEVTLEELEATDKKFTQFGCMPSKNIYGLVANLSDSGEKTIYRSAGGHIHLGCGKLPNEKVSDVVKALDAVLAVPCVAMFAKFDHPLRRQYYGLPGEYRLPKHGIEYRTLSNAWLFHPFIENLVIDAARRVADFGYKGLMKYWKAEEKETIETILNCDVDQAKKIMDRNKDVFKAVMRACYGAVRKDDPETLFNAFYNGMDSVIADPTDIVGNWRLGKEWTTHCNGVHKNVANSLDYLSKKGNKI